MEAIALVEHQPVLHCAKIYNTSEGQSRDRYCLRIQWFALVLPVRLKQYLTRFLTYGDSQWCMLHYGGSLRSYRCLLNSVLQVQFHHLRFEWGFPLQRQNQYRDEPEKLLLRDEIDSVSSVN